MKFLVLSICLASTWIFAPAPVAANEGALESTEYTFTDENVVGELPGTTGVSIHIRGRGKEKSLIRVKTHFVYEMLKSVETM